MPDWTEHLRPRLAQLRLIPARETEIIEELAQHLDQRYEELRGGGTSDADARRLAMEELLEPRRACRPHAIASSGACPAAHHTGSAQPVSARRSLAGSALRRAHAAEAARLRSSGRPHSRVGYRRQYGDLQRGVWRAAEAAAVP